MIDELRDLADAAVSDANNVARAVRQDHPRFYPHLRGRSFRKLDMVARAASMIQANILAELRYRPPPPRSNAEPPFAGSEDKDEIERHSESSESTDRAAP